MPSGQETEWAYSTPPDPHRGFNGSAVVCFRTWIALAEEKQMHICVCFHCQLIALEHTLHLLRFVVNLLLNKLHN